MDYFGKKTFSPVRFTIASGATFVESFTCWRWLQCMLLIYRFRLFRYYRFNVLLDVVCGGICRDTDNSSREKNSDPAPDSADELVFQPWWLCTIPRELGMQMIGEIFYVVYAESEISQRSIF